MQYCPNPQCEATNPNNAEKCLFCGQPFATAAPPPPPKPARSVSERSADILFVLDCTTSMKAEINGIKDVIISFAKEIEERAVTVRIGIIAFRDRHNGEEAEVLTFDGTPFTRDAARFGIAVGALEAKGGGDYPESSLDALLLATRQPFAESSDRVVVLITDAPPQIPDKEAQTVEEVSNALQAANIHQLYVVADMDNLQSQRAYLKLLEGTVGLSYHLGNENDFPKRAEGFKRTLLQLGSTIGEKTRPHNTGLGSKP